AFRRAFGRVSSPDGAIYNIYSDSEAITWEFEDHPTKEYPPRLVATEKATGKALIRRPDDANAGAIIKRIDTYLDQTRPLVSYYEHQGRLTKIDADRSIEAVWADVQKAIEQA
ncbi:MAG: hypothetical protein K8I30_12910, partial [Anaerolineae bacterium]|nr:hypothetical protein [Anaerolineae bacterium]